MSGSRRTAGGSLRVLVLGAEWSTTPFVDDLLVGLAETGIAVTVVTPSLGVRPPRPLATLAAPSAERRLLIDPVGLGAALCAVVGAPDASRELARRASDIEQTSRARIRSMLRCLPALRGDWDVIYLPWVGSLLPFQPLVGGETALVVSCRGRQINIARHDPRLRERFTTMLDCLHRVAAIHCVSSRMAASVRELGVEAGRIHVVRPAVDTRRFAPRAGARGATADSLRLVSVGTLHWNKGHEFTLIALRRLLDRGVPAELSIVGEGPDRGRLLHAVRDLELGDRVRLLGALDRDSVLDRLQSSDVFVLSSLTEGLSNAALEAMACGLPVVSSPAGGMPEAIEDGVEGLLVGLRDAAGIARCCERLWRREELRVAMGAAARRRVERDFDRREQTAAFAELLRAAASRGGREGDR